MSAGVGSALGVAWYTPEAWVQLEAMPEARIEKSYADFVRAFGRIVRELEARGGHDRRLRHDRMVPSQRL